jgi:hypothetical protein
MKATHTPGPWEHVIALGVAARRPDGTSRMICELQIGVNRKESEEQNANCDLIAASPDLLAACRLFVKECGRMYTNPGKETYWFDAVYNAAQAAIRKAEGTE